MKPSNGDMCVAIDIVNKHVDGRIYSQMSASGRDLVQAIAEALKYERVWARREGRAEKKR